MGIEGNSREKKTGTAVKELNQQRKENRKQRMNLPLAKKRKKIVEKNKNKQKTWKRIQKRKGQKDSQSYIRN